jgi:hypothetical protein
MKTEKTDGTCLLPPILVEFFTIFARSLTTARLYAAGHALFKKNIEQLRAAFAEAIKGRDFLFLGFAKDSLFFEGNFHEAKDGNTKSLIEFFHSLGVSHLFLDKDLTTEELESLIALLAGAQVGQGDEVQASLIQENISHASLGLLDYRILSTIQEAGLRSIPEGGDKAFWYQLILQPAYTFSINPSPGSMTEILRLCEDEEELRETLRKIDKDLSEKQQAFSFVQRGFLIGNFLENIGNALAEGKPEKQAQFARNTAAVLGGFEPGIRSAILGSLPPEDPGGRKSSVIQLMIEGMSKRELLFLLLDALKDGGGTSSCFNNLLNRALVQHKEWSTLLALVREEAHQATLERRPGSLPLWLHLEQLILHRQETEEFNAEYSKSVEALASSIQIQEPTVEQEEKRRLMNTLSPEALALQKAHLIADILDRPHTPAQVSEYLPSLLQELGGLLTQFLHEEKARVVGQLLRQAFLTLNHYPQESVVRSSISAWFTAEDIYTLFESLLEKCRTYQAEEMSPINALCQLFPEKASFFMIERFPGIQDQESVQGRWVLTTLTSLGPFLGKALFRRFKNVPEEEIPGLISLAEISMDKHLAAPLEELLGHKKFEIRSLAAAALGRLKAEKSVSFLSEILTQRSWLAGKKTKSLQTQAARALFAIGTPEAKSALMQIAGEGSGELQKLCMELSTSLGEENGRAAS